ncbi:MAG: leucine-rich repeat protein [Firmicutes bacterium]|nr:leucine-rich repeat protein [Bacillota bacterium]
MNKKIKRQALAISQIAIIALIAFVMIFTHMALTSRAVVPGNARPVITDVTGVFRTDMSEFLNPRFVMDEEGMRPQPTDHVTVILGLHGTPTHERFRDDRDRFSDDYITFLNSPQGRNAMRAISNEQNQLIRNISSARISHTVDFRYHANVNAVAVTIQYQDLERVERMPGVVSSVLSRTYAPMSAQQSSEVFDGLWQLTDNDTGMRIDRDTGHLYSGIHGMDGRGTVVAVIDTGFDFGHEIFSIMPPEDYIRFTREEVARVFPQTHAYSAGFTVADVFQNNKVPFAFSYAYREPNVYNVDQEHGTHVAGTVAGHTPGFAHYSVVELGDGEYTIRRNQAPPRPMIRAAAYNAQLVLMKVSRTRNFIDAVANQLDSAAILAAIEDATFLGVDVINLSLGSAMGFSRPDTEYAATIYGAAREAGIHVVVSAANSWTSARGSPWGDTGQTHNPDTGTVGRAGTFMTSMAVGSIDRMLSPYMIADGDLLVYYYHLTTVWPEMDRVYFLERVDAEWRRQNNRPHDYADVPNVYPYIVVPGQGLPVDFIGARGRIAVVARGGLTFEEKRANAYNAGALGLIIHNNVPGRFVVPVDHIRHFGTTMTTLEIGNTLRARGQGYLQVRGANGEAQVAGPFMSDFSSWGPTPDLRLKPEIIGPGGQILSGYYGGRYHETGGTSMSAPIVSGSLAVIRQHVLHEIQETVICRNTDAPRRGIYADIYRGNNPNGMEIIQIVQKLAMGTADIINTRYNVPYFTRTQGAGLINMHDAINTRSLISIPQEAGRDGDFTDFAKLELFDCVNINHVCTVANCSHLNCNWTGEWEMSFNIHNFSETPLQYRLSLDIMTETASADGRFVLERPRRLDDTVLDNIVVTGGGARIGDAISVVPDGMATVTATMRISEQALNQIRNSFRYGMFVEGFLRIGVSGGAANQVDMNLPILAYAGDWTAGPMFDIDIFRYDIDAFNFSLLPEQRIRPDLIATTPFGFASNAQAAGIFGMLQMGAYLWDDPMSPMGHPSRQELVAISFDGLFGGSGGFSGLSRVGAGMLRAAGSMTMTVYEADTGREIFSRDIIHVSKAGAAGGPIIRPGMIVADHDNWSDDLVCFVRDGLRNNTRYEAVFTGHVDFPNRPIYQHATNNNTWALPFFADTEEPMLKDVELITEWDQGLSRNRTFLNLTMFDNHFLKSVTPQIAALPARGVPYRFLDNLRHPMRISGGMGEVVTQRLDITDLKHSIENHPISSERGMLYLTLHDYALNQATFSVNVGELLENHQGTTGGNEPPALNFNSFRFTEQWHVEQWGNFPTPPIGRLHHIGFGGTGIGIFGGESVTVYHNFRGFDPERAANFRLKAEANSPHIALNLDENGYIADDFIQISAIADNATINNAPVTITVFAYEGALRVSTALLHINHRASFVMGDWELGQSPSTLVMFRGLGEAILDDNGIEIGRRAVIPETRRVNEIGAFAFSNYEWRRAFIPDLGRYSLVGVGGSAVREFLGDSNITEIVLPGTVNTIGRYAFAGMPYLETVLQVPDRFGDRQLAGIMQGAFRDLPSLRHVDMRHVSMIGHQVFYNSPLFVPESLSNLTYMGNLAFARNNSITSVDLRNLRSSGHGIFAHNTALVSARVGDITYFGPGVFFENSNIRDLTISARSIADGIGTTSAGNIVVASGAFARMPNLETVTFTRPEGLSANEAFSVDIGVGAFLGAHNLHTVIFEEGVSVGRIGREAFSGTNIRHLSLMGASNIIVEQSAFPSTLEMITLGVNTRLDLHRGALRNTHNMLSNGLRVGRFVNNVFEPLPHSSYTINGLTITETAGDRTTLVAAFGNRTELTAADQAGIHYIGRGAFSGSNIRNAVIASHIIIREEAFADTQFLTSVTFEAGISPHVLSGPAIFAGASALSHVSMVGVMTIPDRTFIETSLINITVGGVAGTLTIGEEAFMNARVLNTFTVQNGPTRVDIGDSAFWQATELRTVTLPASADPDLPNGEGVVIGEESFLFNIRLERIVNDFTIVEIGERAFYANIHLRSINMPHLIYVPEGAFEGEIMRFYFDVMGWFGFPFAIYDDIGFHFLSQLEFVNIPNVEVIGERAFMNTPFLREVVTGENLRFIDEEAFAIGPLDWWMYGSHDMYLPGRWSRLEPHHFNGSNTPLQINLGSVEEIADRAFYQRGVLHADLRGIAADGLGIEVFANAEIMESIQFGTAITHIPYRTFYRAGLSGTTFNLPNLVHIGDFAFADSDIRHFEFANIKHIGHNAFRNNNNMTVGAVNSLEFLGNFAFFNSSIETFEIPRTLEFFGYAALSGTPLRELTQSAEGLNPKFELTANGMLIETVSVRGVPNGHRMLLVFPNASQIENGKLLVPQGVTIVGDKVFYQNTNIIHITFPHSLSIIGDRALYGATNLEIVEFTSHRAPILWSAFDEILAREYIIRSLFGDGVEYVPHSPYERFETHWGHTVMPMFYANFVARISDMVANPLVMIRPENGIGFDTFIFNSFFNTQLSSEVLTNENFVIIAQIRELSARPLTADDFPILQEIGNQINAIRLGSPVQYQLMQAFAGNNYVVAFNAMFAVIDGIVFNYILGLIDNLETNITRENFRVVQDAITEIQIRLIQIPQQLPSSQNDRLTAASAMVNHYAAVYAVIDLIEGLPPLEQIENNPYRYLLEVTNVSDAFDALTDAQRALISNEHRNTLRDALIAVGLYTPVNILAIVLGSVGGALVLVGVGVFLFFFLRKRKKGKEQPEEQNEDETNETSEFETIETKEEEKVEEVQQIEEVEEPKAEEEIKEETKVEEEQKEAEMPEKTEETEKVEKPKKPRAKKTTAKKD